MLGLDEHEEDDIHERVTKEITQAGNQADDAELEDFSSGADTENPLHMLDEEDEEMGKKTKKKSKKKKKGAKDESNDWNDEAFGEKSADFGNNGDDDAVAFDEEAQDSSKKSKKGKK